MPLSHSPITSPSASIVTARASHSGCRLCVAKVPIVVASSACFATLGHKTYGMVEDLDPAVLDALAAYRSATGMELVNMKDGLRAAFRILGEGHILCLVADRAIGEARGAIEVPFAGGIRRVPTGAAVFAQATGAAIVTAFASRHPEKGRGPRYLIEFDPPLVAQGRDEAERTRLMNVIVERMSAAVRRSPDQWFVFQPNWIARDPA